MAQESRFGIPPLKSQGIKTQLLSWIKGVVPRDFEGAWIEPFLGTGVVGFNLAPRRAVFCDANPHLVRFYSGLASGEITPGKVRAHLETEGALLARHGEAHYYAVRDRFNATHAPLDFLFLNRAGFNGMIRFNRAGGFNTPFCRKPQRFSKAYVTKIVNQVAWACAAIRTREVCFKCQDFARTIAEAGPDDLIYCDPPYIGRHADYHNGWDAAQERRLSEALSGFGGKFILSTWHHNAYRENEFLGAFWARHHVLTRQHYYHVGAKVENRNAITEALVVSFSVPLGPCPPESLDG